MCFKIRAADTQTVNTGLIINLKTCYTMFCFPLILTLTDSRLFQRLSSIMSSFSRVVLWYVLKKEGWNF